jgi:CheY-like chemotaxis protein
MTKNQPKQQPVVVVVEDEVLIRMVLVDALTDAGFAVLEASHSAQALTFLEAQAAEIDVLFTDISMPGDMDGLDLAHHARQHWPWIRLLITSGRGYPLLASMPAGSRFLAKAYNVDNVIAHVRELAAVD